VAIVFAAVVLLLAPAASRSAALATSPCPEPPVTLDDLRALELDRGPLATQFMPAVATINERARVCLGDTPLQLLVFVDQPQGLGGVDVYRITPSWLFEPALFVFPTAAELAPGFGDGPFTGLYVPPALGDLQVQLARQWVTVTGHYMDSRASSCLVAGTPGSGVPTDVQAVELCQSVLVVDQVAAASPRPATATQVATATPAAASTAIVSPSPSTTALATTLQVETPPVAAASPAGPGASAPGGWDPTPLLLMAVIVLIGAAGVLLLARRAPRAR
jgi:hypothetical protein